jgi:glucose 1-dehydrogenase
LNSVREMIPWSGHVNYAFKGGIMLMIKSLPQGIADKNIRINGIAPRAIWRVM